MIINYRVLTRLSQTFCQNNRMASAYKSQLQHIGAILRPDLKPHQIVFLPSCLQILRYSSPALLVSPMLWTGHPFGRLTKLPEGYIGSSVLERLQSHPDADKFEITALIRSPQKADKFKEYGVNTVVGSFSDAKLLEDLTAAADIVVDTASEICV